MKYIIHIDVLRARGRESWEIEAASQEDALKMWDEGEGFLTHEEYEADDYGKPQIEEAP
jgi:hypothetical protein